MIDLGLTQLNTALIQLVLRPLSRFTATSPVPFAPVLPNFAAVTSAQSSTEALEENSSRLSANRSDTVRSGMVRPGTVRPLTTLSETDEAVMAALLTSPVNGKTSETDESSAESASGDFVNGDSEIASARESTDGKLPKGALPELLPASETSMEDYYQLQTKLFGLTIALTAFIFPFVWGVYSLQIALDYILGACVGVVYLRMLAKNVSTLGRDNKKSSSFGRLAIFAGLMIVALRWEQLSVVPVFLGFLTYKAAIFAFVLWTSVLPEKKAV